MIADTNGIDCTLIRQSEIGIYEVDTVKVVYSCNGFVHLKDGTEFRLQDKEQIIEHHRKEKK